MAMCHNDYITALKMYENNVYAMYICTFGHWIKIQNFYLLPEIAPRC